MFRLEDEERYGVGHQIARGGMGAIIKVQEGNIGRTVAKKVIFKDDDPEMVERFIEEAQITGQLEHPNIVPVHELAVDETGQPYFTMKLIEGESLEGILDRVAGGDADKFSRTGLLQIFVKICEAISFAHSKNVVHRDLKPDNVMVGSFGEVYVVDWGLAKVFGKEDKAKKRLISTIRSESNVGKTMDGDVIGTPSYMSPEQADGQIDKIDQRSDIFSLGAILYKILTFEPLYTGEAVYNVLIKAVNGKIVAPGSRAPSREIPRELESICMKAISPQRSKRYKFVVDLIEDIQAYLDQRIVSAHRYSIYEKVDRFFRKNWKVLAIALFIVSTSVIVGIFGMQALARKRLAEQEKTVAIKLQDSLNQQKEDFFEAMSLSRKATDMVNCSKYQEAMILIKKGQSLADLTTFDFLTCVASYHLRKFFEAVKAGERGRKRMPMHFDVRIMLGYSYDGLGEREKAVQVFEDLTKTHGNRWRAWKEFGRICLETKQYERALKAFKEGLRHPSGSLSTPARQDIENGIRICKQKLEDREK